MLSTMGRAGWLEAIASTSQPRSVLAMATNVSRKRSSISGRVGEQRVQWQRAIGEDVTDLLVQNCRQYRYWLALATQNLH